MKLVLGIVAAALALACAGCGGDGGSQDRKAAGHGDAGIGARIFSDAGCADCHTLAAARSKGTVGPNLDDLAPSYSTVVRQVSRGGIGMPSFEGKLSGKEIRDVATFVVAASDSGKAGVEGAAAFRPDGTKISDCAGDFPCLEQAFGNLTYRQGPRRAIAVFARKMVPGTPVEADCHRIAHSIGASSLVRFHGDVGRAFTAGSAICGSGYYHGILERAFRGVPDSRLAQVTRRLCSAASIRRTQYVSYQCVHGLGHGLMIYTGYDLPRSLRMCHQLQTSWDQRSCTGGVFMENLSSSYGVKSRWLRDDDLIYPCRTVAWQDKYYCYEMVTSRILPVVKYDWRKTAAWCRRSEKDWIATCFESFGRDVSGQTRQEPREIARLCKVAGDMERQCIYGAVRDVANNYANGERAAELCRLARPQDRAYCVYGLGTLLRTLFATDAQRVAACRVAGKRYLDACKRGAELPPYHVKAR